MGVGDWEYSIIYFIKGMDSRERKKEEAFDCKDTSLSLVGFLVKLRGCQQCQQLFI